MLRPRNVRTVLVTPTAHSREDLVSIRRSRVQAFEVAEDGTVELPEGAIIISLDFEGEGPYGYETRPVRAWAEVPEGPR